MLAPPRAEECPVVGRWNSERRSQAIPGKAEEGASLVWLATDENAARGSLCAASPAALLPGALADSAELIRACCRAC